MSYVVVFSSPVLGEAHLIHSVLLQAGVPSELRNTSLMGAAGEIPMTETWAKVTVPPEHAAEAEALVAQARAEPEGEPHICPSCGEESPPAFERCWSCEADLAEIPGGV